MYFVLKNSVQYVITAVVAIAAIVLLSVFIRSSDRRFTLTLESLNSTLTTQAGANQGNAVQGSSVPNSIDIVLPPAGESGTVAVTPATQPSVPQVQATNPPVQENPATQAPSTDAPAVSDVATQPPAAAPTGDAETIAYLNNAVNTMRATQNMTAVKQQTIDIKLTDCSAPAFTSIINGVINGMMGTEEYTYTFVNGVATDPEENTQVAPKTAIPPTDKDFNLMADGIASMSSASDGTNTVYTIVLKPESSTKDAPPVYHGATMDCFDFAALDIPIEVTSADFNYHGATIDITIDAQGRVVKYHENMPLDGVGGGKMGFLSATATLEGYLDETWTITY